MAGVTYSLDDELSEDLAMLYGSGWEIRLEKDSEGEPKLSCSKEEVWLDYSYREGEGRAAGCHFYGRSGMRRYAVLDVPELRDIQKNSSVW